MNIVSCIHPLRVYNRYLGEWINVPCRKCYACRNVRQATLTSRIQYESQNSKHSIFFTLTYAPEYVPHFTLERDDNDDVIFTRQSSFVGYSDGDIYEDWFGEDGTSYECFRLSDLPDSIRKDNASLEVLARAFRSDYQFRVVDKKHVQDFLKRLRFHIQKFYDNEKIRYFIVSEYGCDKTSNFRPHYHGLLFTESDRLAKDAYKVLCACWKLGFVASSPARGKAAGYVAKYVNSSTTYPKIYECFSAKPFALYSRRPALGVPSDSSSQAREIVFNPVSDITLYSDTTIKAVPFWRSIESRFFPKCRDFNKISHHDRIRSYSQGFFYEKITKEFISAYYENNLTDQELYDLRIAKRVQFLADNFNVSLEWYVSRIEDYYNTKSLLSLSKFYDYQCKIADTGKWQQLVNCYPDAVLEFRHWIRNVIADLNHLPFGMSNDVSLSQFKDYCDTYLYQKFQPYFRLDSFDDWLSVDLSSFSLESSPEYLRFVFDAQSRNSQANKNKRLNDLYGVLD